MHRLFSNTIGEMILKHLDDLSITLQQVFQLQKSAHSSTMY